ncbi:MAG: hypothetical protein EA357_05815 [Micavibrio sp.]|nr:MAG: hypothetical protein EA357_05815 [Micavibrio sp.]
MEFLRKLFNRSSENTELSRVRNMTTRKLPVPDVGGGYYIRFFATKDAGRWKMDYETNCDFSTEGKMKSLEAFRDAQTAHKSRSDGNLYVETAMLILADLEEAHLRYANGKCEIEQDKKQMRNHYVAIFDKMPEGMQESIGMRWKEYQDQEPKPDILPQKYTSVPATAKRLLPGKRPDSKH